MRASIVVAILAVAAVPAVCVAAPPASRPLPADPAATTGAAAAAEDARRVQVLAATANAAEDLRARLLDVRLTPDLLVRDYLDKAQSTNAVDAVLRAATPVGGPRVDGHTCQVRLTVGGDRLSAALLDVARDHPDRFPVTLDQLRLPKARWAAASYTGDGRSTDAATADRAPRPRTGAWAGVDDDHCRAAVAAARADAVRRAVESLGKVRSAAGQTLGPLVARPAVAQRVTAFLNAQPVSPIDFHEDLTVSLSLFVNRTGLSAAVRTAAVAADPKASADVDWKQVSADVEQLPATVAGLSVAERAAAPALPRVVLPLQPPGGVAQDLEATAVAPKAADQLKAGKAAEDKARAALRGQLLDLRLTPDLTLADAVKRDPSLSAKVDHALDLVPVRRTRYKPGGTVEVRLTLDVQRAWDELLKDDRP